MTQAPPSAPVGVRHVPAALVCAAAPAFFVVALPWLGWLLLALRRRTQRCDECDRELGRHDERVETREWRGAKRTLCAECARVAVPAE